MFSGEDLTGKKLARWTVTKFSRVHRQPSGTTVAMWSCECSCGVKKEVNGNMLRIGRSQSCGCYRKETTKQTGVANLRHGHSNSPTYRSWMAMIQRCTNPEHNRWECYGGRGITVCEEWRIFDAFLTDMGERPGGTSIDRIDVDGNYEPQNCRWATASQQAQNRR